MDMTGATTDYMNLEAGTRRPDANYSNEINHNTFCGLATPGRSVSQCQMTNYWCRQCADLNEASHNRRSLIGCQQFLNTWPSPVVAAGRLLGAVARARAFLISNRV